MGGEPPLLRAETPAGADPPPPPPRENPIGGEPPPPMLLRGEPPDDPPEDLAGGPSLPRDDPRDEPESRTGGGGGGDELRTDVPPDDDDPLGASVTDERPFDEPDDGVLSDPRTTRGDRSIGAESRDRDPSSPPRPRLPISVDLPTFFTEVSPRPFVGVSSIRARRAAESAASRARASAAESMPRDTPPVFVTPDER